MKLRFQITCLLLLVSIFQTLFAQDYNPLPQNLTQLYAFVPNGFSNTWFFAARVDSVVVEGADSASYLYRIVRLAQPADTALDCQGSPISISPNALLPNQDHYFGAKMLRESTGLCRFVSSASDTFNLESQAPIGAVWTWNGTITAAVDSIVYAPVLGQMDSVKYINLSDGRQIQLSQHFGFVRAFPFLPFYTNFAPDMPTFELWGIPEVGLGEHLPSIAEIFDFDNGDKLQTLAEVNPHFAPYSSDEYVETIYGQAIPGSTIQYNVTRERALLISAPPAPTTTYTAPTAGVVSIDSVNFEQLHQLPYETPDAFLEGFTTGLQIGVYTTVFGGRIGYEFNSVDNYDTCAISYTVFERNEHFVYTKGLGLTFKSLNNEVGIEVTRLICYAKGTETYGMCQSLGLLYSADDPLEGFVRIFPNPANHSLQLSFAADMNGGKTKISIIGLDGRTLFQTEIHPSGNRFEIPTADFPAGMMILHIEKEGYQPFSQRFVVQH